VALSDGDRAILDFERTAWMLPRAKDVEIREQLRVSPTRYYKVLQTLADSDDALEYDPLLVRRLRRSRDQRRRARFAGRSAPSSR
jgi:hypothetical protein